LTTRTVEVPPAVTVTTPLLEPPVLAEAVTTKVSPWTPVTGVTVSHTGIAVTSHDGRFVETAIVTLPPAAGGFQALADRPTPSIGGISSCVTTKVALAGPAVKVTVPVRGSFELLLATVTVNVAPSAPVAGETVSHAASEDADQAAWFVETTTPAL